MKVKKQEPEKRPTTVAKTLAKVREQMATMSHEQLNHLQQMFKMLAH